MPPRRGVPQCSTTAGRGSSSEAATPGYCFEEHRARSRFFQRTGDAAAHGVHPRLRDDRGRLRGEPCTSSTPATRATGTPPSPPVGAGDARRRGGESVCGNRGHGDFGAEFRKFTDLVNETMRCNGTILIPAYSADRTQKMRHFLYELQCTKEAAPPDRHLCRRPDHEPYRRLEPPLHADPGALQNQIIPFDLFGIHGGISPKRQRGAREILAWEEACAIHGRRSPVRYKAYRMSVC